jgi:hypothetical protein
MITSASHLWLRLHRHYRANHLAFAGGILDQPNKYAEAMELLTSTFNQIEREQMEQARRDHG